MRANLAVTLLITVAIGPASALGAGVTVGGTGVGVSIGLSKNGASVGISTSGSQVGGANAGVSVAKNGKSTVGVSGKGGGKSGGKSGGAGLKAGSSHGGRAGTRPAASGGSVTAPGSGVVLSGGAGAGTVPGTVSGGPPGSAGGTPSPVTGNPPAGGLRPLAALPRFLWPFRVGRTGNERGEPGYPSLDPTRTGAIPAIPRAAIPLAVVRACRQAIVSAASPLGAVWVGATSAGPLQRDRRGALVAPLAVRIDYARQGGIQVRQARITCRLDSAGRVISVI